VTWRFRSAEWLSSSRGISETLMARTQPQPTKSQVIPRIDPDEDFSDVDGDIRTEFALDESTVDPGRHYQWAHKSPDDIGSFVGGPLQYRVEHVADGGVKPKMGYGLKVGDAITKRDHVLISCDKGMWDKRERYLAKKTRETNAAMFKKNQRSIVIEEA
jgi:hypothetical protein